MNKQCELTFSGDTAFQKHTDFTLAMCSNTSVDVCGERYLVNSVRLNCAIPKSMSTLIVELAKP